MSRLETSAVLLEIYQILQRAARRAHDERQAAASTDTAGSVRPPSVGDRRTNNEAAPAPASTRDGFAEDDREAITTDEHAV
jgi:hypothetical protein